MRDVNFRELLFHALRCIRAKSRYRPLRFIENSSLQITVVLGSLVALREASKGENAWRSRTVGDLLT